MQAKRFFYVCAGLFLLALSYHLGVRSAQAQAGATVVTADVNCAIYAVVGRTLVFNDGGAFSAAPYSIPGSASIVSVGVACGSAFRTYAAVLGNGDVYEASAANQDPVTVGPWSLIGNVVGAPTAVQRHTLGQLKARFRYPAPTGR